tara:strand:+ start:289 stop:1746 length:1458 start_codon:yes stop_codon:yes gene_type:complete
MGKKFYGSSLVSFAVILFLSFLLIPQVYAERGVVVNPNDSQSTERRIALVIGNSAYKSSPLKNPVNDAQDMTESLRGLGFDVIHRKNANKRTMVSAMNEFGRKLRAAEVGLFYYAGHGMQVNGRNYLIPVGSQVESESDVEFESVDAGRLLGKMEDAESKVNIVILDACRNNPFARSFRSSNRGLAIMTAPTGSFVAFATAPGSVAADGDGRNGIFTQHLLKHIKTPGLKIEEVLKRTRNDVLQGTAKKQTPWQSSSLTGDFYFLQGTKTATVPSPDSSTSSLDAERLKLQEERRRIEAEKRLMKERKKLAEERRKLEEEKKRIRKEQEQMASLTPSVPEGSSGGRRSSDGRYVDHGDGTITDTKTNLMWTKKDSYADTGNCMDWNASKSYVNRLNIGGYSNWRMPTVQELKGLYEESKKLMAYDNDSSTPLHLDTIFADGAAYGFWSSETAGSCCARVVYFNNGNVGLYTRGYCSNVGVRAVRR